MGLDITAYSHLSSVGNHTDGQWCYDEDSEGDRQHIMAFAYDDFPRSFEGIPVLATPRGYLWGGCYEPTAATKTHKFCAGSYTGYGHWRDDLARQFNPQGHHCGDSSGEPCTEPDPDKPFYRLIWFADNEGVIGPSAAASLLADFRAYATRYDPEHYPRHSLLRYADWMQACTLAAQGGLIVFH